MHRNRRSILKSAVQLAILYIPLFSLLELIEAVCPFASIYALSAFGAFLCFCVLFSDSGKAAWKTWGFSVPLTLIFWYILTATDFHVRLTNQLSPGYGALSADAGFAFILRFGFFTVAQGLANLLAVACSAPLNGKLQTLRFVVQRVILPTICASIAFVILYLELTMPTWQEIYYAVYG